ncbi:SGNH/GDSL hydrolase family protein [Candidatus Leptofilum sp.]|uniref:SGNH/GDSL hydrolase family protein n=1 Tax=Candidatus Leptofilum sp. TaxID=3241576 RepID=UPI003B5979AA
MKRTFRLKTAVPILLIILLLGSLALNGYLFLKTRQYYLDLNGTRLDPLGLRTYPVGEAVVKEEGEITAVFFGDSRAAQWPNPTGMDGYQFINRGIGSQTSVQVAARFQQHVAPLQPDLIIVQMCINDLKTIPLFPQNEQAIIQNCLANIDQVLAEAENLGAKVILTTVFPVGDVPLERRIVWSPDIAKAVTAVNEQIHTKAGQNVFVFNTHAILVDERGLLSQEYARDELHLNEIGYIYLNEKLIEFIDVQELTP